MGRPKRPNAIKIWEGQSTIQPDKTVMVVVTGLRQSTSNEKTGDMLQSWILLKDTAPHHAVKTGEDEAICGSCPLRPFLKASRPAHLPRPCYVKTYQAPRSVWQAHKDKPVTPLEQARDMMLGRAFRYGAYGDPAAVPQEAWAAVPTGGEG